MKALNKIWFGLQEILRLITGVMLLVLVSLIFVGVITRYVFFHSLPWSEELSRYLFIWIVMLATNIGIRNCMEIKIDVIDTFIKGRGHTVMQLLRLLVSLVMQAVLFKCSVPLYQNGFNAMSPAMHVSMAVIYVSFLIGFTLNFIEYVRRTVMFVLELFGKKKEGEVEA